MSTINTNAVAGTLGPLSPLTSGFYNSLAQPLKKAIPQTYSPGYSGRCVNLSDPLLRFESNLKFYLHMCSPRAFFNSVLTNGDGQLKQCSAQPFNAIDGSPCAYLDVSFCFFHFRLSVNSNIPSGVFRICFTSS